MSTNANVEIVRAIGKGERLTETAVEDIVASLPADFDPTARGAIAEAVHQWAHGDNQRPAVKKNRRDENGQIVRKAPTKSHPSGQPVQDWTDYGQGHKSLTERVKRALATPAAPTVGMRVILTGPDESGSLTVEPGTELWDILAGMIRDNATA